MILNRTEYDQHSWVELVMRCVERLPSTKPEKQPPRTIEVLAPVEPRRPPIRYLGPVGIRSGRQSFR